MVAVVRPLDAVLFRYQAGERDCLRAALATILGLKPVAVPDFMAGAEAEGPRAAWKKVDRWLETRGLYLIWQEWPTLEQALVAGEEQLWLLIAGAGLDFGHAYVGHGSRVLWCPLVGDDPDPATITPEPTTGSYWQATISCYEGP